MAELKVLFSKRQIDSKIRQLARRISRDYKGKDLAIIGVLKGSFIFVSDLVRKLSIPAMVDFIQPESFRILKRHSGKIELQKDIEIDIKGKHVLLVDDVVASGYTIDMFVRNLKKRKVASVAVCCLLDNEPRRKIRTNIKYRCFKLRYRKDRHRDRSVVGYGTGFDEHYRLLPYLAMIEF